MRSKVPFLFQHPMALEMVAHNQVCQADRVKGLKFRLYSFCNCFCSDIEVSLFDKADFFPSSHTNTVQAGGFPGKRSLPLISKVSLLSYSIHCEYRKWSYNLPLILNHICHDILLSESIINSGLHKDKVWCNL